MDSDYRSYIRHSASNNFLINVAINGALGWWLLREHESLTVWGAAEHAASGLLRG